MPRQSLEGMAWLRRREGQLEDELHKLLDAQSDALLSGVGSGEPMEDMSSNGSQRSADHTPQSISPSRNPSISQLDLVSVRQAIYRAVRELSNVKGEEEALVKASLKGTETTVLKLESWDNKRTDLQKEIDTIQRQEIEGRTQTLQNEADKLQDEITEMEQQLNRMRQQHTNLLEQISQIENSVQSRLSTYTTSLNILEEDIQKWLKRPSPSSSSRSKSGQEADFYSLPANRRTLEMAHDHWINQHTSLDRQRKGIRREKRALEQGALVWKEVVTEISSFERTLQREMSSRNAQKSPDTMSHLLAAMDDVITMVESKLEFATKKKWNLLIACIGAELEAFRQGRDILQKATSQRLADAEDTNNVDMLASEYESSQSHIVQSPKRPSSTRASRLLSPIKATHDSDDDGPDPQLLVALNHFDSD